MRKTLKGLILAGGKSKRLGVDKTRLLWLGQSLLEHSLEVARECCAEVWVSGRDPGEDGLEALWLPDEVPGAGPVSGIMSGLKRLGCPLLVLACDLPLMDSGTLKKLIAAWEDCPEGKVMTTFQQMETGYIESLVAIYEPEAVPMLARALEQGVFQLSQAVPPELRHHVPYPSADAMPFFNLNYPADLALLKRISSAGSTQPMDLASLEKHR